MLKKILVSSICATLVVASNIEDGVKLYENKDYVNSYKIFKSEVDKSKSNSIVNFYLALNAKALGLFEEAMIMFERVLVQDENHQRARLELADTFISLNMLELAKSELDKVLESNPPQNVKENIEKMFAFIESKDKKDFSKVTVSAGFGYDTNLNSNPGREELINYMQNEYKMDKQNVQADDKIEDTFLQESLFVSYVYDIGNKGGYFIDNSFTMYNQNYFDNSDFDLTYLSVSSGLGFLGDGYKIDIPISADKILYSGSSLMDSLSIGAKFQKPLIEEMFLTTGVKAQKKYYKKEIDSSKNSNFNEAFISLSKKFDENMVSIGYAYAKETLSKDVDTKFIDKSINSYKIAYFRDFDIFDLMISCNLRDVDYEDTYSKDSGEKRMDLYKSYQLNVSKELMSNLSVMFNANYIDNSSKYLPVEYEKEMYSINLNYIY
ncbi:MAG: tetratricopeptide repeat protein [Campylobacterales bacterium]|nr:tetratricopeptide repeat protein [Campylobacterales bacterium]